MNISKLEKDKRFNSEFYALYAVKGKHNVLIDNFPTSYEARLHAEQLATKTFVITKCEEKFISVYENKNATAELLTATDLPF